MNLKIKMWGLVGGALYIMPLFSAESAGPAVKTIMMRTVKVEAGDVAPEAAAWGVGPAPVRIGAARNDLTLAEFLGKKVDWHESIPAGCTGWINLSPFIELSDGTIMPSKLQRTASTEEYIPDTELHVREVRHAEACATIMIGKKQ